MNTTATRTYLRKYAEDKSPKIQGAVRNLCGTLRLLDRDPKDDIARAQLAINLARFEDLKSALASDQCDKSRS